MILSPYCRGAGFFAAECTREISQFYLKQKYNYFCFVKIQTTYHCFITFILQSSSFFHSVHGLIMIVLLVNHSFQSYVWIKISTDAVKCDNFWDLHRGPYILWERTQYLFLSLTIQCVWSNNLITLIYVWCWISQLAPNKLYSACDTSLSKLLLETCHGLILLIASDTDCKIWISQYFIKSTT